MKGLFYKETRSLWHFGKTYLLLMTAVSLAVFIGSWALSVKWFEAREL